jgi:hypothetical protein
LTLAVATRAEAEGALRWRTKRGTIARHELPSGWLTVEQALALPLPDTSWMNDPWPRSKFTAWLERS